jgi:hypothetical protein
MYVMLTVAEQAQAAFAAQFDHQPMTARQICAFPERAGHMCSLARAS